MQKKFSQGMRKFKCFRCAKAGFAQFAIGKPQGLKKVAQQRLLDKANISEENEMAS